jgi:hypothetical protein
MIPEPSSFLVTAFVALAIVVAPGLAFAIFWAFRHRANDATSGRRLGLLALGGVALWMAVTYALAASGLLEFGPLPPPIAFVLVPMFIGIVLFARSRLGQRLAADVPLAALVAFQAFRWPLELIMHRAYSEGIMPVQMSYSGRNFDILTGISALVVAMLIALKRMPPWGVKIWNWAGTLLLANIVIIALVSTPTPIRVFQNEPANVWITDAPFIWLPALFVAYALLGHLLIFRKLRLNVAR